MGFQKEEFNMSLEPNELEREQSHPAAGAAMTGADAAAPPRNRGTTVSEAGELATEGISETARDMLCEAGAESAAAGAVCEAAGGEAVVEAVGEVVSGIIGSIFDGL